MLRFCFILLALLFIFPSHATVAAPRTLPPTNPLVLQRNVLSFRVQQAGIVTIAADQLATAGWPLSEVNPAHLHVYVRDAEVPIELVGGASAHLVATDAVRFVVAGSDSRWTDTAVYWLTYDDQPGLRAPTPALLPNPYTWERDGSYDSRFATVRGDHWFAAELRADSAPLTLTLTLPAAAAAQTTVLLGVHSAVKRTNHQLVLRSGTNTLGSVTWNDAATTAPITLTMTLARALPAGNVPLTLQLASAGSPTDAVLLDRITFPALHVTAHALPPPTLTAQVPFDLRTGPGTGQSSGTFVIITHASLRAALDPLIAAHEARGDRVAVVDAQAAYDTWSDGETNPEALRSLIRTAVAQWQPAPRAVLLVGAGSVKLRAQQQDTLQTQRAQTVLRRARIADPLRLATTADDDLPERTNLIPPYLVDTDPLRGEIACDTCFTRIATDTAIDDPLPALPIGRFPVRTLAETELLVAKTVTALAAPPRGSWEQRAVVVADNDYAADSTPDDAGSFTATAETGVSLLPPRFDIQRFYYAPDRAAYGPYDADVGRLRCRMFRQLDGGSSFDTRCAPSANPDDTGAALWMYVGHGSEWQWAATELDAEVPYLYYLYDADGRHNGARLPILLSMACLTGDWSNAVLETTDERLLLHADGGIVAALSSSGQDVNTSHARLLSGLIPALYRSDGDRSLGAAHLAGLQTVRVGGHDTDLSYSFNLLGDPAVTVPFVPRSTLFLPWAGR